MNYDVKIKCGSDDMIKLEKCGRECTPWNID